MPKVSVSTASPKFTLDDFCGEKFSLNDLEGSKNALLVFNRGFM